MQRANRAIRQFRDLPLVTIAGTLTLVQAAAFVVIAIWFDPTELPSVVTVPVPLLSGAAAVLIGWDATTVEERNEWWRPRPWVWAFAMIPPGLNLGVTFGYLLRRIEVDTRDHPSNWWFRVVVPSVLLSAASFIFVSTFEESGTVWELLLLLGLFCWTGALAVSVVATYYDVRFVATVLETAGSGWQLRGYHWVPLLTLVLPANALVLGLYYLRRRNLLADIEPAPDGLLAEQRD